MRGLWARAIRAIGGARWAFFYLAAFLLSILVGVGFFTFGYAGGWAYFGEDPQTCKQCHSMNKEYDAWTGGSHRIAASCQDCHSPQRDEEPVAWLMSEADNGFWHSFKFTTGMYPQNIKIRPHNREIVERNCLRCHGTLVEDINSTRTVGHGVDCLKCHSEVGHKR